MVGPARGATRRRLDMLIGTVLLAGALVALGFPVYLNSYDRWGLQMKCGTGYHSQLLQATIADQQPAQQSGPATNYVNQCKNAVLHRRVWVFPVAGLGAAVLIPELVAWARRGSRSSGEPTGAGPADLTDAEFHEAAVLDRRYRSHRPPPHDTTL